MLYGMMMSCNYDFRSRDHGHLWSFSCLPDCTFRWHTRSTLTASACAGETTRYWGTRKSQDIERASMLLRESECSRVPDDASKPFAARVDHPSESIAEPVGRTLGLTSGPRQVISNAVFGKELKIEYPKDACCVDPFTLMPGAAVLLIVRLSAHPLVSSP